MQLLKRESAREKVAGERKAGPMQDSRAPFFIYEPSFLDEKHYQKFSGVKGRAVDLGCGAYPFPWADTLVEIDPFGLREDSYGGGVPLIIPASKQVVNGMEIYTCIDGRHVYVLDMSRQQLPFANKIFDYAFTSHSLEHLKDPGFALSEIQRVAARGCIRFPRRSSQLLYHDDDCGPGKHHEWIMEVNDDMLIFRRIIEQEREFVQWRNETDADTNSEYFPQPVADEFYELTGLNNQRDDAAEFLWNGAIAFEVRDAR